MSTEDIIFLVFFLALIIPTAYLILPRKNSETQKLKKEEADKK